MKRSSKLAWSITAVLAVSASAGVWFLSTHDDTTNQGARISGQQTPSPTQATSNAPLEPSLPAHARRVVGRSFTFERGPVLRPPGDPNAWIASLKPSAEAGDAEASYGIYLALIDCEMYIESSSPESLRRSRSLGATPEFEKTVQRKLAECESLPTTQLEEAGKWLSKAASQGSIEAQVAYATSPNVLLGTDPDTESEEFRRWKSNSISFLNEAVHKGSIDALSHLSNAYMAGTIVPRDPTTAYAIQLALSDIRPSLSGDSYRDTIAQELTPQQISIAQKRGKEFFQIVTQQTGTSHT